MAHTTASTGQRRPVVVSRAQRVWLDRAAAELDQLGLRPAHREMARVLREVADQWRASLPIPEDQEDHV